MDDTAGRLQHIVLLQFPTDLSTDEDAELRELVDALRADIPGLLECRVGRDLTGERSRGYQYLLFTMFPDAEALAGYVVHPTHQRLVAFLDARACQRLAFDTFAEAEGA